MVTFQAFIVYLAEPGKQGQTLSAQRSSVAMHLDEHQTAERLVSDARTDDLVRYANSLVAGAAA